jgi:uncharacterized protein
MDNYSSEEKILAGLAHVAILILGWIGLVAAVVLYFVYKPKSGFVAAHAKQAAGFGIVITVISLILGIFGGGMAVGLGMLGGVSGSGGAIAGAIGTALIVGLIGMVLGIGSLVLVIIAAIKGFTGKQYQYPVIGNMVNNINV